MDTVTVTVTAAEAEYIRALITVDEGENEPEGVDATALYAKFAE